MKLTTKKDRTEIIPIHIYEKEYMKERQNFFTNHRYNTEPEQKCQEVPH